jgi:hypothetical protein
VSDQDKSWIPHICCVKCVRLITGWLIGSHQMPFAIPFVWRAAKEKSSNFYVFFNQHISDHLKIPTHSEMSRFGIYNKACPTQWRVACSKASRKSDCKLLSANYPTKHNIQIQCNSLLLYTRILSLYISLCVSDIYLIMADLDSRNML